ncbi:uncharacterized protein LOC113403099 [Vanessa tameamea]|uniref:Uncharacterized protein LOC113403099 n=1 Tax=Vanessa tameamea TaxID=334116 RepID=A0ABM4AXX0_VANTA
MVSLKLLIVVALVATVACTPHLRVHHGKHHGKRVGITISAGIGDIFKGLNPSPRVCDSQALNSLLRPKRPKNFNDVLTLLIHLTQGVGGIMDKHYEGMGSLSTRMVIALARISVCQLGAKKFHSKPHFCSRDFHQFGVKGSVQTVDAVYARFKVNKATEQVNILINKYTNNKGIGSVNGTVRVYFRFCLNLAALLDSKYYSLKYFKKMF